MATATVRVNVKSPIYYNNIAYKVGSELDIDSNIYQSHKEYFDVIQFRKNINENKKIEVNNE